MVPSNRCACGIYLSKLRRFYDISKGRPINELQSRIKDIFGVCSAAGFYKRQMLEDIKEKTGYFDERFFFLVEDVDVSWRAQAKGWKALFFPHALCRHLGNSSNNPLKARRCFCFRNRYLMIFKNEKRHITIIKLPFYLAYDVPRLIFLAFTCKSTLFFNIIQNKSRFNAG